MYKLSEIISLPIISIFESENIGIVNNVLIDKRLEKIKFLTVYNEDNTNQIIDIKNIFKIGNDCILIKNKTILDLMINNNMEIDKTITAINSEIYNLNGDKIGKIKDVFIDEKFQIKNILLTNEKLISLKKVLNTSNQIILISNNDKCNIKKFTPIKIDFRNQNNKPIKILENVNNEISTPKITTETNFLIGRTTLKNIISNNNELIIRKNTIITKAVIKKASQYGKLIELAKYSAN